MPDQSGRRRGQRESKKSRTVEGKRLNVLEVIGEGHELVAKTDGVLALGDAVKLLEVGVGDGLGVKREEWDQNASRRAEPP